MIDTDSLKVLQEAAKVVAIDLVWEESSYLKEFILHFSSQKYPSVRVSMKVLDYEDKSSLEVVFRDSVGYIRKGEHEHEERLRADAISKYAIEAKGMKSILDDYTDTKYTGGISSVTKRSIKDYIATGIKMEEKFYTGGIPKWPSVDHTWVDELYVQKASPKVEREEYEEEKYHDSKTIIAQRQKLENYGKY